MVSRYVFTIWFQNVTNFSRRPYPLTGAFTVNNSSNIKINYLRMDSVKCEDGLNIVNSNFIVDFAEFNETYSDAIDVDFGNGVFQNILMDNIGYAGGGDGLDVSGSIVIVRVHYLMM